MSVASAERVGETTWNVSVQGGPGAYRRSKQFPGRIVAVRLWDGTTQGSGAGSVVWNSEYVDNLLIVICSISGYAGSWWKATKDFIVYYESADDSRDEMSAPFVESQIVPLEFEGDNGETIELPLPDVSMETDQVEVLFQHHAASIELLPGTDDGATLRVECTDPTADRVKGRIVASVVKSANGFLAGNEVGRAWDWVELTRNATQDGYTTVLASTGTRVAATKVHYNNKQLPDGGYYVTVYLTKNRQKKEYLNFTNGSSTSSVTLKHVTDVNEITKVGVSVKT